MSTRGTWFMRDRPVVIWLMAALLVSLIHPFFAYSRWLMVHLVVLGAVTHAAMVWSVHFTEALLKTKSGFEERRLQTIRLSVFQAGALLVFIGVPTRIWVLTLIGGSLVSVAVIWHAIMLVGRLKAALPGRFRITVRYYVVAALLLPVGATFGVLLARGTAHTHTGGVATGHGELLVAHTMVNLLGWIGLTVLGTLVTLWPTMLRTKMADNAESASRQALPVLTTGLALLVASPFVDEPLVGIIGVAFYLGGTLWVYHPILVAARRRPPYAFPTLSAGAGLLWLPVGLVLLGWSLATRGSWDELAGSYGTLTTIFVVGFALQVLLGALSYLLPVVIGGGPSVLRAGMAELERWSTARVATANIGLALCLLPVPSLVRVILSVITLLALALSIPLMLRGIHASVKAKKAKEAAQASGAAGATPKPSRAEVVTLTAESASQTWSRPQLIAAVTVIALGATLGIGLDPSAAGLNVAGSVGPAATVVTPTGHTTTVKVEAKNMRFTPSEISVPAGDRLVIEVANTDESDVHDLVLATGESTGRISPGEKATLEVPVVSSSIDGWCSVVGHRQMGMVFAVKAIGGQTAAQGAASDSSAAGASGTTDTSGTHGSHASSGASPAIDFMKKWGPDSAAYDPVLPPLTDEKVHRVTLTVQEVELEVAPGVKQLRWTYNGTSVAPTLHGRVGDTFEVTLVNKGTMGHSIDFHASEIAPDGPMRTIEPGQSLVYRFTAKRSGIWMYHCSTMPMATHIAAGMAGAVVIEPEGLPSVDRSYLMVQSEVYLGAANGDPVNADKVMAKTPDAVVFNGAANQYVDHPLQAKVGERVRIWVLDVGPSLPTSFHVVGGQFDTVYKEGTYLLKNGRGPLDPPGMTTGGSQALDLAAAQGGFVELSFPAPGHYSVVNHIMVDAERGARGVVEVTP